MPDVWWMQSYIFEFCYRITTLNLTSDLALKSTNNHHACYYHFMSSLPFQFYLSSLLAYTPAFYLLEMLGSPLSPFPGTVHLLLFCLEPHIFHDSSPYLGHFLYSNNLSMSSTPLWFLMCLASDLIKVFFLCFLHWLT